MATRPDPRRADGVAGAGTDAPVHGLRENVRQVSHQIGQVFLVGMTLGMMRTVVPALAESEFGVAPGSFLLLVAFVVAFGVVKGTMNLVAGRLSDRWGRRRVLLWGWVAALPIPAMVWIAPGWSWIVAATVLLGASQGLTWSMTQTAKLDLARADQRGMAIGLNEFAGYLGVAVAGVLTGYAAGALGPRGGLLAFGLSVVSLALALTIGGVRETRPWAEAEAARHDRESAGSARPRHAESPSYRPGTREVFGLVSWRDRRLAAVTQAGLVEKFVDALVWVAVPAYLYRKGVGLPGIGWVVGAYGFVWGGSQLVTGPLSDRVGRFWPNVLGMWTCGAGIALFVLGEGTGWWALSAGVAGFGMALLYPNLSASVADLSPPAWRGSAIGVFRFWRDMGYGIGALGIGVAAHLGGGLAAAFWFVAAAMGLSGAVLWRWGEETHPRLAPPGRQTG